jgi:hypothetical protein
MVTETATVKAGNGKGNGNEKKNFTRQKAICAFRFS